MKHRARPEEAENPFWITYSDLLSSMVLLLLILLVVFIKISEAQRQRLVTQIRNNSPYLEQLTQQNIAERTKTLAELRKDLKKLKEDLANQDVEIGLDEDNLTLSVSEKILFDRGKDDLRGKGKTFLRQFIPPLARTITAKDKNYVNFSNLEAGLVTGIIFEGQADPSYNSRNWDRAYLGNLDVTLTRSKKVVSYIFSQHFKGWTDEENQDWSSYSKERFRYLVTSSGRSSMDRMRKIVGGPDEVRVEWTQQRLWDSPDSPENAASRQVVIQLKLYNPLQHFEVVENGKPK